MSFQSPSFSTSPNLKVNEFSISHFSSFSLKVLILTSHFRGLLEVFDLKGYFFEIVLLIESSQKPQLVNPIVQSDTQDDQD